MAPSEHSYVKPEQFIAEQKAIIQAGIELLHKKMAGMSPDTKVQLLTPVYEEEKLLLTIGSLKAKLQIIEDRSYLMENVADVEKLCQDEPLAEMFIRWHDSLDNINLKVIN